MDALSSSLLDRAAALIRDADALVVAAGAGIGVDSGLPDFRGNEGFWRAYPALGKARIDFASAASPATFRSDPRLAWGFYGHRLALYRATVPHAGFALLKRWGEAMPNGVHVFTSNVDGQFQKAGFDPARVHECHGSIHHLQCLAPCGDAIWEAEDFVPEVDADACRLSNEPPRCPHCGGLARPNILMFGDWDWIERRSAQQAARLEQWLRAAERPVVIELGAGTAIPSVRQFSHQVIRAGGRLVRINPREPEVPTKLDVGLPAGALEGLSALAARL
ncbi:NAD-dependent SIR2 family protein deacetylase [Pseudoduganella flava]|uniref:protein acetyllysine N-acetyltransferase n=1 Tax=Pseudoduganella flava TaxID=871742 RepID=A0A562PTF1_9BURK|nr:Sir2 family NAD-dependent protein deacetylase [Pseudoduganella flava]QGZ39021.1 NAD-dependent deacetylase [Pseudoduganella flava]TWI47714.1 NAD-dependent SIR2 family protein deacetylase [Pseudoduganella flava]